MIRWWSSLWNVGYPKNVILIVYPQSAIGTPWRFAVQCACKDPACQVTKFHKTRSGHDSPRVLLFYHLSRQIYYYYGILWLRFMQRQVQPHQSWFRFVNHLIQKLSKRYCTSESSCQCRYEWWHCTWSWQPDVVQRTPFTQWPPATMLICSLPPWLTSTSLQAHHQVT